MKRKANNLYIRCSSINNIAEDNIEEAINNEKKKKVKFEESLNIKPTDLKGKNIKKMKHNRATEKADWFKLKKEKIELKKTRKAKKLKNGIYNIIIQAKQINEKLRRSDCTLQDHIKLTRILHGKLETLYNKIIFTHDMSRIIQCIIKYCEADIRYAIFHEIKSSIIEISQSTYAKNCIKTILKYGSQEIRSKIISSFYGNIIKLMTHTVSAPLIEFIYFSSCNYLEKLYFKQEFYGDMYKQTKDKTVKTLMDVFENAEDVKPATLSAVKTNLIKILEKGIINSTLLHTVLWEFFYACSVEDRSELIFILRNFIVPLSQTKMGTKIAMQCIWHGNNKDRKIIIKALKGNVKTVSMSEYGYLTLLALFDSVDDTVIMKKIILTELEKNLIDIVLNEYGKHVILYLVARRDSHYFPPSIVEYLCQGDYNLISKKSADIREKELLEVINNPLLEGIIADTVTWLSNSSIAMVTLAILKVGSGQKLNSAFQSIAKFVSNRNLKIMQGNTEYNVVEHPGIHMMLKKLIQNDKELLKEKKFTFGEILILQLTSKVLEEWIKFNRACFLLIALIENEAENIVYTLVSRLKPLVKNLESKKNSGTLILLKKIEAATNIV